MERKAIPEVSAANRLWSAHLEKFAAMNGDNKRLNANQIVTYDELDAIGHLNCRQHRGILAAARNNARRACGALYAPVAGVGIKLMDDDGVAAVVDTDVRGIHRRSVRIIRKSECVRDIASMTPDVRKRMLAQVSCLCAIQHATTAKTVKKLGEKVGNSGGRLALEDTLAAMK